MAYSITQDHKGTVWIGTKKDGVIAAKPRSNNTFSLSYFRSNRNETYSISNNDIWQIYEDSQQRLWFATWDGGINYLEYSPDSTIRFINHNNKLKNYPIQTSAKARSIISDGKGHLWIATPNGLLVFDEKFTDPSKIIFKSIKHIPGNSSSLNNDDIQFIYRSSNQNLFIATFGGGLNKLLSYDKVTAHFKSYTEKDGLLSNILLAMQEDEKGNIWISMIEGLSKFSINKEHFVNYSAREFSEPIRFNDGNGCYSKDDKSIFFNTQGGILSFNPESVDKSSYTPPIVFTRLQLGNYTVHPGDSTKILDTNINDIPKITLKHYQNSFSIHFAALDLIDPVNILYSYRLRGFNDTWYQSKGNHIANYTNIPKGNYILEIRSTNSDGVWTDNTRQLPIYILPSFWESYWGISLYIIIGIIILSAIFTYFKLKQKVRLEKKLSDLKLQFFTNISHELRTPLTLISAPVKDILKKTDLDSEMRNHLQIIERNSSRMNRLVDEILDFRKVQNRNMKLRIQRFDLIDFSHRLMLFFDELAKSKQIDFVLDSELSTCMIWADTDKLEKILFNLLGNAFKYTPQGKQIKLKIEEDNDEISISVSDQGIGIHQTDQKRIFMPFETISIRQFVNQSGTGIGLALVKELVEMHHTNILLNSEPDKGSTFIIKMRKGKDHFNDSEITYNNETSIPSNNIDTASLFDITTDIESLKENIIEPDSSKATLLIVEDNAELRYFLRTIFKSDFNIIEAENGALGLISAQTNLPDIIISDIMMPEKDGVELLRELRLDITISHIPIILLTAKSTIENQISGIELGADDYITKPFSSEYLKVRLVNLLEQRKKLQQYYQTQFFPNESVSDTIAYSATHAITSNSQMFMKRLIASIDKHMNNGNLTIEDLAQETGMSRVVFFKKVKDLTGLSPIELLKDVRLKHAAKLIKSSDLNISQIAFNVGFNDAHYFSKCFKLKYGITPSEYREGVAPLSN